MINTSQHSDLIDAPDTLVRCLIADSQVRAVAVNLYTTWINVLGNKQLPLVVQNLLGELCAVTPLLAATLKLEGSLIIQIQGDLKSPVRLIVVEYTSNATLRASVTLNDAVDWSKLAIQANPIDSNTVGLQQLVNVQGLGRFIVMVDPKNKHPGQKIYTSLVPIVGDTVANSIDYYMANSEQLPTRVLLASNSSTCAGILIQRMPVSGGNISPNIDTIHFNEQGHELLSNGLNDDTWMRMRYLMNTIQSTELLSIYPVTLLRRLFWQENPTAANSQSLQFFCGCSRQKVQNMLKILGVNEINSILVEQGKVTVNCDYCDTRYQFDTVDCAAIMSAALHTEINSVQ